MREAINWERLKETKGLILSKSIAKVKNFWINNKIAPLNTYCLVLPDLSCSIINGSARSSIQTEKLNTISIKRYEVLLIDSSTKPDQKKNQILQQKVEVKTAIIGLSQWDIRT